MEPNRTDKRTTSTATLLPDGYAEAGDPLNAPAGNYALLVLFPYYNHLVGVNLLRAGVTVRWVESLEAAWKLITLTRPNVVLCWIGRNRIGQSAPDGLALLKQILDSEFADIPTVAIVGERGNPDEAMTMGATAAFVVPFAPQELIHRVKQLM